MLIRSLIEISITVTLTRNKLRLISSNLWGLRCFLKTKKKDRRNWCLYKLCSVCTNCEQSVQRAFSQVQIIVVYIKRYFKKPSRASRYISANYTVCSILSQLLFVPVSLYLFRVDNADDAPLGSFPARDRK